MERDAHLIAPEVARRIRIIGLDVDGVMTDGRVVVDEDGREAVVCSRRDGFGLERLREAGVSVVVVSKERNPVVNTKSRG